MGCGSIWGRPTDQLRDIPRGLIIFGHQTPKYPRLFAHPAASHNAFSAFIRAFQDNNHPSKYLAEDTTLAPIL